MEDYLRLVLAAFLGGAIGFERECFGKVAGLRTHALVSMASCLLMIISVELFEQYHGQSNVDPGRIAAQVVTGIGFIGAGAIIRSGASVKGITTAACLWAVSAIGLACGMGLYGISAFTTLLVIVILLAFQRIEDYLLKRPINADEA